MLPPPLYRLIFELPKSDLARA
ncbi:hypothetical protein B3ORF23 [Pseudomonas phage B3]|uniref:Uncharacterized protein n=1 Tax=Pseudomonas phage B3 TaxID=151599 RepID=Q5ZQZ3_9CAUD|nr:hypothetical protein B3ORF23 [Pseudomonas phage B3]AAQ13941.1 hypothetical protein B3ORF23 [Pseudomonas phage B3]